MILVAGSANLDFVVRADHIPAPSETVLGQAFSTYPGGKGANQAVACARAGGAATHMLLQLEIPLPSVTAYALAARAQGVKVVLNAAPAQPLPPELLAAVDVLIVNEGELAAIVPCPVSLMTNLAQIAVPCVVVTLGGHGCAARLGDTFFTHPAFEIDAVDTTGAGDTFCGVPVAALDQGASLTQAMQRTSAAAALACTRAGAQSSIPTTDEVNAFLAAQPAWQSTSPKNHQTDVNTSQKNHF